MAFPDKLLNQGEHVVVHTRSHPKALLLPAAGARRRSSRSGAYVQRLGDGSAAGIMHLVVWVLVALALVWWVVRPVIAWATTTYTFTNRRFIKRSGLVSKEGRTIPLNRISGVDFEIGVIDRIFGCGTLIVSDASETGIVPLHDIPDVEEVQLKVAEELHRLANHRSDDGT